MPTYAQIQAMRARAQAKAYKPAAAPPKKTGARDPYNALGGFTDLQSAYLQAVGRGPDYSGIEPINYDELRRVAETSATKGLQPYINQLQDERGFQNARRDVSNQAATNFTTALAGLFTGGKPGAEGEAYSLANFGGSYLAGVAAMLGTQLMAKIGHTFDERDHELANKISLLMDKHPEEADRIYGDLLSSEQDRVKQGQSIVDADYKSQIAALGAAIKFERDNRKDAGGAAGKPYVSYFTDPATGARMGVRPDGTVVPISGAASAEPMSASQVSSLLGNADTIVSESVNNGATFKDALLQARMYLRDNGVKNYGQWAPYTTPAGPGAKAKGKSQNFKMGDGSIWRVNPDGTTTQIKSAGNTGKTPKGKETPSPTQISTTTARATKAGEAVLEKVTDNIWSKMPGSAAEKGTDEYTRAEAAYNSYLDSGKSFGTAMSKVIAAISPHLKAIGYKSAQIRRVAYQIVTQQINPPRGYKAPGR